MASCITTSTAITLTHPLPSSPSSTNFKLRAPSANPSTQPSSPLSLSPILPSPISSTILPWNSTKSIQNKRGLKVVTRAGPPSTTSLIAAFVMPITLVLATVFTSIRIADKLDEDFLEEVAINEGIMAGEEGDGERSVLVDDKSAIPTWAQEKPDVPRTRNRPKREAQV